MEDEYVLDFSRIFFGNLPWLFLIEILLRTIVMYLFALFVVRILGKRGQGQLAPFDFVIIIALGSAVGDPMFYAKVPLLHAMVAISVIVGLTRGVVHLTERNRRLKNFLATTPTRLVADGCLDLKGMHEERISRGELFQALRGAGVQQLGEIERAYLEPSGKISTFLHPPAERSPGLAVLPDEQPGAAPVFDTASKVPASSTYACWTCGRSQLQQGDSMFDRCPRCGGKKWTASVSSFRECFAASARPPGNGESAMDHRP